MLFQDKKLSRAEYSLHGLYYKSIEPTLVEQRARLLFWFQLDHLESVSAAALWAERAASGCLAKRDEMNAYHARLGRTYASMCEELRSDGRVMVRGSARWLADAERPLDDWPKRREYLAGALYAVLLSEVRIVKDRQTVVPDTPVCVLRLKRLNDTVRLPTRAYPGSTCFDLAMPFDLELKPGVRARVRCGWAFEPPEGTFIRLYMRSSWAMRGVELEGGVSDCDYRGEITLSLYLKPTEKEPLQIAKDDRVVQFTCLPYMHCTLEEVTTLGTTLRGERGTGSSGNKALAMDSSV
jgi:dUTP pyrophosphatase